MTSRGRIGAPGPLETEPDAASSPVLVSLHYLRSALRRRWRVWVGLGLAGFVLGVAATVLMPAPSVSRSTVILAHDPAADPALAMATDLRLLGTRTVAQEVIDGLGLAMTPDDFHRTVTAEALTSEVLAISVHAEDQAAATERTELLTDVFMEFRAKQISAQSEALVDGYDERIAALERQVGRLTQQYETVTSSPTDDGAQAADLLAQRTQANQQISEVRAEIADIELKAGAIIEASRILDDAGSVPQALLRRTALAGLSGLVGGTALGIGLVLTAALTTTRLRRREDVSRALAVTVRSGVGRIRPSRWTPWRRDPAGRALDRLVQALESAMPAVPDRPVRLALASVDNPADATLVVAGLGVHLARQGVPVLLIDLSRSGDLQAAVDQRRTAAPRVGVGDRSKHGEAADVLSQPHREREGRASTEAVGGLRVTEELRAEALVATALTLDEDRGKRRTEPVPVVNGDRTHASASYDPWWPAVFRSHERAELARGPLDVIDGLSGDLPNGDPHRRMWERAEVVLTLVEVAPDGGTEALSSWADQVVPVVTAGASSMERLQTTAELLRTAGLELPFAVMIGCDSTDESIGSERTVRAEETVARSQE